MRSALILLLNAVAVFGCYKLKKYLAHTFIVRDKNIYVTFDNHADGVSF
jgi:hypothetical protein